MRMKTPAERNLWISPADRLHLPPALSAPGSDRSGGPAGKTAEVRPGDQGAWFSIPAIQGCQGSEKRFSELESRSPQRGGASYPPKDAAMETPGPSTSGSERAESSHPEVAPVFFRSYSHCLSPRVTARMKPILLQGHERSITQIKYNREGDLLFTVAKDPIVNVWYSVNGERLGTYMGHTGAVWCVDADWDTKHVLTGSADNSCRLWDCETGKPGPQLQNKKKKKRKEKKKKGNCNCAWTDLRQLGGAVPHIEKMQAIWAWRDDLMSQGLSSVTEYVESSGEVLVNVKEHSRQINDIQLSRDMTMFVTASKDNTAKLFDSTSLEHQKTFRTERPVNSAALSPNYDHVVLGGGQEAMDVTTTSTRIGKFEARFFHLAFEEEFGRVKGHFGPINSVAFHPDGKSYSSGGEDGYVRIHYFDPQYFEFEFEA
uniref:Eukaryotic translation initiation factor 3 subunit I n=1 Tax=Rattus norvegicus TaxID=10116 RepID=M0RCH0_RAT